MEASASPNANVLPTLVQSASSYEVDSDDSTPAPLSDIPTPVAY